MFNVLEFNQAIIKSSLRLFPQYLKAEKTGVYEFKHKTCYSIKLETQ